MVIRSPWQFGGRSDEQVMGILPKVEHSFRKIDDPKTISLRGTSRMSSRRYVGKSMMSTEQQLKRFYQNETSESYSYDYIIWPKQQFLHVEKYFCVQQFIVLSNELLQFYFIILSTCYLLLLLTVSGINKWQSISSFISFNKDNLFFSFLQ